ncbi:MAG: hypothetical protein WCQ47_07500, partial [bacterium]
YKNDPKQLKYIINRNQNSASSLVDAIKNENTAYMKVENVNAVKEKPINKENNVIKTEEKVSVADQKANTMINKNPPTQAELNTTLENMISSQSKLYKPLKVKPTGSFKTYKNSELISRPQRASGDLRINFAHEQFNINSPRFDKLTAETEDMIFQTTGFKVDSKELLLPENRLKLYKTITDDIAPYHYRKSGGTNTTFRDATRKVDPNSFETILEEGQAVCSELSSYYQGVLAKYGIPSNVKGINKVFNRQIPGGGAHQVLEVENYIIDFNYVPGVYERDQYAALVMKDDFQGSVRKVNPIKPICDTPEPVTPTITKMY